MRKKKKISLDLEIKRLSKAIIMGGGPDQTSCRRWTPSACCPPSPVNPT